MPCLLGRALRQTGQREGFRGSVDLPPIERNMIRPHDLKKGLSARFMRRGQSRCVNELLTSSDRQRSYAGPLLSETRR